MFAGLTRTAIVRLAPSHERESLLMPPATREQANNFNELQRLSGSSEGAVRYLETTAQIDVREFLPKIKAPTLVMHLRDDRGVSIELGRDVAAKIPGARFVALPGSNHIMLEQDPGIALLFYELRDFLNEKA